MDPRIALTLGFPEGYAPTVEDILAWAIKKWPAKEEFPGYREPFLIGYYEEYYCHFDVGWPDWEMPVGKYRGQGSTLLEAVEDAFIKVVEEER